MPRSTLRHTPRDVSRKTRGQDGFAISFPAGTCTPTTCRFSPAHGGRPPMRKSRPQKPAQVFCTCSTKSAQESPSFLSAHEFEVFRNRTLCQGTTSVLPKRRQKYERDLKSCGTNLPS